MPIYEYLCKVCNKVEQILKSFKEFERKEHCETCKAEMERQISGNHAIHFKGTGFYATDYKRNK